MRGERAQRGQLVGGCDRPQVACDVPIETAASIQRFAQTASRDRAAPRLLEHDRHGTHERTKATTVVVIDGARASSDVGQVSPAEIDRNLTDELADVRLIAEIGLSTDRMDVVEAAVRAVLRLRGRDALLADYPALLSTYLAGEGLRSYGKNDKGNGYWNLLSVVELRQESSVVGAAFRDALERLKLPNFALAVEAEGGRTNLMPILLHAGIAASSVHRFWESIRELMVCGAEDAVDVVAAFRRTPTLLAHLPQPVRRLVSYGGDLVVDLVDRIIETEQLLAANREPQPASVGLPDDIVAALVAGARRTRRRPPTRLPRPRISIDPYSGSGPELELPPVPPGRNGRVWILEGAAQRRVVTSAAQTITIDLLQPDRSGWVVRITNGQVVEHTWFLNGGVVTVFGADGTMSKDQSGVRPGDLVLCPATLDVRVDAPDGAAATDPPGQFPPLIGPWSGWCLHRIASDVPAGARLLVGGRGDLAARLGGREHHLQVLDQRRASWVTAPVPGVVATSGDPVLSKVPRLRVDGLGPLRSWRIVSITEGTSVPAVELDRDTDGCLDIRRLLAGRSMQEIDLVARGPLGSDTRLRALLVTDLEVVRPEHAIAPDEDCEIAIDGPGLVIGDTAAPALIRPEPGATRSRVQLSDGSASTHEVDLVIPRVVWRIADGPFQGVMLDLAVEDVADAVLGVRLGVPGDVALVLLDGEDTLFSGPAHRAVGDHGVWNFRLAELADTIRASGLPRIRLCVNVDGRLLIDVALVRARYVVTRLDAVGSTVEGTLAVLHFAFTEEHRFRGREIVLWPLERPWAPPRRLSVPDDADSGVLLELVDPVPGRYLAHLTLADEWNPSGRPQPGEVGTVLLHLGDPAMLQRYIRLLPDDDPLPAFERALLTGGRVPEEHAPAVAGHAVRLMARLLELDGADAVESSLFRTAENALFVDPQVAAREIAAAEVSDEPDSALRFAAAIFPDVLDCPLHTDEDPQSTTSLWRRCAPAAAALQPRLSARWVEHLGWASDFDRNDKRRPDTVDGLPDRGTALDARWLSRKPQELEQIRVHLSLSDDGPLSHTGFVLAMFELLVWIAAHDVGEIEHWRSKHARLNDKRCRRDPVHSSFLDPLEPPADVARWTRFPQDVLAAAIHLAETDNERCAATHALMDAVTIAPRIVTRSLLLAAVIHRL